MRVVEAHYSLLIAELPYNDYFEYYGPDFKLHITPSNMTNQNTADYIEKIQYACIICFNVWIYVYC